MKSINQIAQETGDTSANEAARIKANEAAIRTAWRRLAYEHGEAGITAGALATATGLPASYARDICARSGYALKEGNECRKQIP